MKHMVSLDSHIDNTRRLKKMKGQKDRLIDALRDLVSATVVLNDKSPELQKALDKSWKALKLACDEYESH